MNSRKLTPIFIILVSLFLYPCAGFPATDELKVSTYLPAPYITYQNIQVTDTVVFAGAGGIAMRRTIGASLPGGYQIVAYTDNSGQLLNPGTPTGATHWIAVRTAVAGE